MSTGRATLPPQHPELIEIERIRKEREAENQREEATDSKTLNELQEAHQQQKGRINAPDASERYSTAMKHAGSQVMKIIEGLESRLEKRETTITANLNALKRKRPNRLASLVTGGKAMRSWRTAVDKQTKALEMVQKRRSTVHAIRQQESNFSRTIQSWTQTRAIRLDQTAVLEHEAHMERMRQAEENKRLEQAKINERNREQVRQVQRDMAIERKIDAPH